MGLSLRARAPLRFARRYLANPERLVAPRRRPGSSLPLPLLSALLRAERPALVRRLFCLLLSRSRARRAAAAVAPRALRWSERLLVAVSLWLFARLRARLRSLTSSLFCSCGGAPRTLLLALISRWARRALRRALLRSGAVDRFVTTPLRHRLVATATGQRRPARSPAPRRSVRRTFHRAGPRRRLQRGRRAAPAKGKKRRLRTLAVILARSRPRNPLAPPAIHALSRSPRGLGLGRRLSFRGWFRAHLHKLQRQRGSVSSLVLAPRRRRSVLSPVPSPLVARAARQRRLHARALCCQRFSAPCAQRQLLRTAALRLSLRVLLVLRILFTRPWAVPRALHRRPLLCRRLALLLTPALSNALLKLAPLGGVPRSPEFRLRARSLRTLHSFLARLRLRYGFKRRQPPFRLDTTVAAYRAGRDRATEKLELYRLLKVARRHYGHLTRGQLWRVRRAAAPRRRGGAAFHSLLLFESRLDVLLLRARLSASLAQARQLIRRGWVCVNGLAVFSYRFVVSLRDVVAIHPRYRTRFRCRLLTEWTQAVFTPGAVSERVFPPYLELDFRGPTVGYVPTLTNLAKSPTALRLPKTVLFRWGRYAH